MTRRVMTTLGLAMGVVLVMAGVASAHVEVDPGEAPKGGTAVLTFAVPNEKDTANTVQVDVQFPTDHPIAVVDVQPVPGWTAEVKTTKLATPLTNDGEQVTEVVSEVIWSGGQIEPGQFQRFPISADGLPDDTSSLEFKTLQTYSDGDVVRWVDPTTEGQPEPEHPAPVLQLVSADKAATDGGADTAAKVAVTKNVATTSDVDSARTVGIIGIAVGAVGVILALIALVRRPRSVTR
jgi:uncharacterized protein YcnI